jgi:hypothetical protein
MKVSELDHTIVGKHIKVTAIHVGEAERAGIVNDSQVLTGQEGIVTELSDTVLGRQLWVQWHTVKSGLALVGEDEIEILGPKSFTMDDGSAQPVRFQGGVVILQPLGCGYCGNGFWVEHEDLRRLEGAHPCPFCSALSEGPTL